MLPLMRRPMERFPILPTGIFFCLATTFGSVKSMALSLAYSFLSDSTIKVGPVIASTLSRVPPFEGDHEAMPRTGKTPRVLSISLRFGFFESFIFDISEINLLSYPDTSGLSLISDIISNLS